MKKKIIGIMLAAAIAMGCTGCGSTPYQTEVESEQYVGSRVGRFIILEDEGTYKDENSNRHHQYLVYDYATYIIYVYEIVEEPAGCYNASGVTISPFYCMNIDNNPQIAVYYDGMEAE